MACFTKLESQYCISYFFTILVYFKLILSTEMAIVSLAIESLSLKNEGGLAGVLRAESRGMLY